ncbi:MAG TPA: hypothetical protein VE967_07335 [Gemmatimonadaceae bacterium]|nr:hypothetical protein [Gemmatimonadaceae bacterium]
MPKYLIEVEHEPTTAACNRAIEIFLRTGSHFLTHADWGCKDGVHKAWFTAEVDTKDEARSIVPSDYRHAARIVMLTQFTGKDLEKIAAHHQRRKEEGT